jgi:outer membrane protein, heavy metal efflux system
MALVFGSRVRAAAPAIVCSLLMTMSFATGAAAEAVTEGDVVRATVERAAARELRSARLDAALAERKGAGRWANPEVGWTREELDVAGATESQYYIRQELPLGGKLRLAREAAAGRYEAATHELRRADLERISRARRAFHEALYRDASAEVHAAWAAGLDRASQAVAALHRAGDASRYESERIAQATGNARALAAAADAERAHARERLVALTGDSSLRTATLVRGDRATLRPLESYLESHARSPSLVALLAEADATEADAQRAARAWVPDLAVTVGEKRVNESGLSDTGLVLGFSMPLPVFDRGSADEARLRGEARALRQRHALEFADREAEVRGAWQLARNLEQNAARVTGAGTLGRIATAAYQAGEGTLLELIDAHDAERETALVALDLDLRARLARIELDALVGESP